MFSPLNGNPREFSSMPIIASFARSTPPSRDVLLTGLYAIDSASYDPTLNEAIPDVRRFPAASNSATLAKNPVDISNHDMRYRFVAAL